MDDRVRVMGKKEKAVERSRETIQLGRLMNGGGRPEEKKDF